MKCRFCDSVNIRTSRWQGEDLFWLLFLHLPMRCHDCIRRDHRNIFLVLRARSAERERRRREDREDDAVDRDDVLSSQKS
jgi:hypothetical protein